GAERLRGFLQSAERVQRLPAAGVQGFVVDAARRQVVEQAQRRRRVARGQLRGRRRVQQLLVARQQAVRGQQGSCGGFRRRAVQQAFAELPQPPAEFVEARIARRRGCGHE